MPWFRRHRTGRPPHPDVLTPAEWRVLEHVREGRTNPEIASILGVSSNTVKTQVSSMLGKLALENRAQLAAWRGVPADASRMAAGRFSFAGPLAWVWRHASTVAAGAGVVGAVALFMFAMQGANESAGIPVAPAGTAAPTSATEEAPAAPPVEQAVVSAPLQLDGTFTVVVYPSTASEQPPSHIERVTVSDGRVTAQEMTLDPTEVADPASYLNSWRNIHYPIRAAGDVLIAAVCVEAQCGGMGAADPAARTMLVRSLDGGATWDVLTTLDGAYWVWSWTPDGSEVILLEYPSGPGLGRWEFVQWPSMSDLNPPSIPGVTIEPRRSPIALGSDELAWWSSEGLVDRRGTFLVDFAALGALPADVFEASVSPDGRRLVLTWSVAGAWRWTLFERDASGSFEPLSTLEQPAELYHAVPYSWLDRDRVLIPTNGPALDFPPDLRVGYIPAVVDFETGEVAPVLGFERPDLAQRGNLVIRVEPD